MELVAPMRLYTLSKRHFVLVFVVFFICFGVIVFIGIAGPEIITSRPLAPILPKGKDNLARPIKLRIPGLSTYNQELWLMCRFELNKTTSGDFRNNFTMKVSVSGAMQDASVTNVKVNAHNHTRLCHCAGKTCDEIIVLHLGYLNYTEYIITVSFYSLQELQNNIKNVNFTLKMYNASFSQVEIWFRFIFVVFTFMVTCLFAHSLRKFSMRDWAIEQKWMSILLPLLLLYNDPFFPLSFLVNSWFPGMLDDLFQAIFLCALLLFWLCVYHGIRLQQNINHVESHQHAYKYPSKVPRIWGGQICAVMGRAWLSGTIFRQCLKRYDGPNGLLLCCIIGERKFVTFYLPKILIVGLLWLAAVTLGIWQTVNELHDPTYQYRVDTNNFQGMKVFFLIVGSLYILYLIFLIVRACTELKNMPYFDLRLKFLTGLTFIVLVISIIILYLRFGSRVLQDNFVAELSTHYKNSAEFLSFYGLLNFYLYTLAYVYSPSKNAVYESQLKDNPAFSMLNDSDDDVIYGSDYEEMPLQNGRAIKSKYRDESDSD